MFSPAATPDRRRVTGSRRASSRSASVQPSGASTPQTSNALTPRALGAGLHAASRALSVSPGLQTPTARRSRSVAGQSDAGEMDLDEGASAGRQDNTPEQVLVRDENYTVLQRRGLPVEVEQVLLDAGELSRGLRGVLAANRLLEQMGTVTRSERRSTARLALRSSSAGSRATSGTGPACVRLAFSDPRRQR